MHHHRPMSLLTVALLASALLDLPVCAGQADPQLQALFEQYLEGWFKLRPLEATRLGDHRFDDRLDEISPAARARWVDWQRSTLNQLTRTIPRPQLSSDGRVDFAIFQRHLEFSLWLNRNLRPFEQDPRVYGDYINESVYLLLTQSTRPKETNIAHAIARMAQIPAILDTARECLTRPPRVHTETAIRQNLGAIAFYEKELFEIVGRTPQLERLRAAAQVLVSRLREYQRFLEKDLLPRANGNWRLGRAKFARKLEFELDAGLSAQEVLADAEAEFSRVEREMYVLARQLWHRYFPRRELPPDDLAGRQETLRRVLAQIARDHGRPENLTADVRGQVADITQFIRANDILRLPEPDRCQVIEMPEFQRGNSTAYMNSPPPLDSAAAGYFAVSPPPHDWEADRVRSYLEEYNRHMLRILAIHEAYPGHYVQYEYANRQPSLIRRVLASGTYVEGWAVYTEQMMLDQGYGAGDLALRLTQLKFYLRAVANAILDHQMQAGNMSDEAALELLVGRAYQSEGEARLKIIRAKQSSAQLSTYFVGRMAHYRLRQQIQRECGDRFVLGRYHEAVLAPGPVPVKFLPDLVRQHLGVVSPTGVRTPGALP